MASIYPMLASQYSATRGDFLITVKKTLSISLIASLVLIGLGFIRTSTLLEFLGGHQFTASVVPFRILLFSIPFFFINNIIFHIFLIASKMKYSIFIYSLGFMISGLLNFYFIPRYGYMASSVITVFTEVCVMFSYLFIIIQKRYFIIPKI